MSRAGGPGTPTYTTQNDHLEHTCVGAFGNTTNDNEGHGCRTRPLPDAATTALAPPRVPRALCLASPATRPPLRYVRMYDQASDQDIFRLNLTEDYARETALEFGRLQRAADGTWVFWAKPEPLPGNGQEIFKRYHGRTLGHAAVEHLCPSLDHVAFGLGWDVTKTAQVPPDLDVFVFGLDAQERLVSPDYAIHYHHLSTADGSIRHRGDARDGEAEDDDEVVEVRLQRVAPAVQHILFGIQIYDAEARGHSFDLLDSMYTRMFDPVGPRKGEFFRCLTNVDREGKGNTSVVAMRLDRQKGSGWAFHNVCSASKCNIFDRYAPDVT